MISTLFFSEQFDSKSVQTEGVKRQFFQVRPEQFWGEDQIRGQEINKLASSLIRILSRFVVVARHLYLIQI